ncbi:unnamed protein product, partial [Pelagomonas calceolata]
RRPRCRERVRDKRRKRVGRRGRGARPLLRLLRRWPPRLCSWCGAERCKRVAVLAPGAIAHFKLHVSYQLHTVGLPKAMKCRS